MEQLATASLQQIPNLAPTENAEDSNGDGSPSVKKRTKKYNRVSKACVYCSRSHIACDQVRPCRRCVARGIAHLCRDSETTKKRGRKGSKYLGGDESIEVADLQILPPPTSNTSITQSILTKANPANPANLPPAFAALIQARQTFIEPHLTPPPLSSPLLNTSAPLPPMGHTSSTSPISIGALMNSRESERETIAPVMSFAEKFGPLINDIDNTFLQNQVDLPPDLKGMLTSMFSPFSGDSGNYALNNFPNSNAEEETGFFKFYTFLNTRLPPEELELVTSLVMNWRTRVKSFVQATFPFTWEQVREMCFKRKDILSSLDIYKERYDELGTPTLVLDRSGTIYYVNPAYREITGFPHATPTDHEDLCWYKQLSPQSLADYLKAGFKLFATFPEITQNSYMIPAAIKTYFHPEKNKEVYIEGTASITFKRNEIGVPVTVFVQFLPRNVQIYLPHSVR